MRILNQYFSSRLPIHSNSNIECTLNGRFYHSFAEVVRYTDEIFRSYEKSYSCTDIRKLPEHNPNND